MQSAGEGQIQGKLLQQIQIHMLVLENSASSVYDISIQSDLSPKVEKR